MNNVVISGRLTRAVDLRYMQNGNAVANITIAVDKNLSKDKREEMQSKNLPTADFVNVVAFGKLAENLSRYMDKGLMILVSGSIQTDSYEKDGQRVYTTKVLAHNIEFLEWKDSTLETNNNYKQNTKDEVEFEYGNDIDINSDARIPF